LKGLTDEPHDIANKKISRREALSMASRLVIATSTTSLVAGFAGYFLGSSFKKEATRTLTETKYETITETKTEIKTETKYVTITTKETIDREKPVIKRVIHEKYGLIGSPYYVDIEATDNVGIESVIIEVLDPKGELSYYNAKRVEKDIYRASFIPSVKGLYRAKAIVKDASGNVSVSESFKMISLTETEERLRRICQNERIFEKGYELVNDLNLSDRKLRNESLEALKNYSIALLDLGLPYERDGLSMLVEASEKTQQ
jgi:hypothetical protein